MTPLHPMADHGLPDPDRDAQFYQGVPARRLVAWIVDLVLAGIIAVLVLLVLALPSLGTVFFLTALIWAAVDFGYRVLTLAGGSATPGMRFMGIELRDRAGNRLDLGTAVLHTLGYHLSMGFAVAQVVSVILMLGSARGQGLTDHVLGTAMINRPI